MKRELDPFEQNAPATQKPEKLIRCNPEHGGCGHGFTKEAYNPYAMLCKTCAHARASTYGFTLESCHYSQMDGIIPYYERKVPGFGSLGRIEQCRILAFASGCHGVLNLTEKERERALKIRAKFPILYVQSDREEPLKVVKQIEAMTEVW